MNLRNSHNPYFNRWFSAILKMDVVDYIDSRVTILILIDGFLQCLLYKCIVFYTCSHNPYFNRWFSAMKGMLYTIKKSNMSQSLF